MKSPLISIIVPAYNAEAFLGNCIDSVSAQKDVAMELIIIDDGSTDATPQIIAEAKIRHPKLLIKTHRTANVGVSEARNIGIGMAEGDYIAFLDADDSYVPDAMQYLLCKIQSESDIDIVIAQFRDLDGQLGESILTGAEAVENTLYQHPGYHEGPWAKLYRRSIFDSGVRFAAGRRYEDMEVCPDFYMQARRILFCGHKVYNYTENPQSFINTWTPARLDALWATESIAAKWSKRFPGACRNRRFSACFNIFNLACANNEKAVADKCWNEIRALRRSIITDHRARLRNRLAAIASYLGKRPSALLIRTLHLHGR